MGSRRIEDHNYMTRGHGFLFKGKARMVMLEEANKEDIEQEFMQGIH